MYNAEKYIADCLDSILNSDLPKDSYEVIIVNDGSDDKGPIIANEYVRKYENFVYLSQENQGQSVARNYGICECHGEYIWCVDSDDRVASTSLRNVYKELIIHPELDVLAFCLKEVNEDFEFININCAQNTVFHNSVLSGRSAILQGFNPSSVCALFIKRCIIIDNKIFFKGGMTRQDVEFSYRLMAVATKVLFTNYIPYIYIRHPNSTSKSIDVSQKIKYISDDILVYKSFSEMVNLYSDDKALSSVINQRAKNVLFGMLLSLFYNRKKWKPLGISSAVLNELEINGLYPLDGKDFSFKKKIVLFFLNKRFIIY